MATASFDKRFFVSDAQQAQHLREALDKPHKVRTVSRNYTADKEKGIALLTQRLSNSQTC